jgi:hypothetical protein
MQNQGPLLEVLTRRLVEIPADFLDEPLIGTRGQVAVAALVNDLLLRFGGRASAEQLGCFHSLQMVADRNRLALVMIAVWLLADEGFSCEHISRVDVLALLTDSIAELAASTAAQKFVYDADRREELVRVMLARLNMRPAGESIAQASDRLSGLSSTERNRLLAISRAGEQRARAIREALAKKAADESADKWTRE